jgi:hypothetical protein
VPKVRIKSYIFVILILLVTPIGAKGEDESALSREYQVKAAFLYNFIQFTDWPKEKGADSNEPIIIGIIGSESFTEAFKPIGDKQIKNRSVVVKYFADLEEPKESKEKGNPKQNQNIEALKKCHLLMFCTCESIKIKNQAQIIAALKGSHVLTVGETPGFLEAGGMINFLMEEKKVRFEINLDAAGPAKLEIRSKLLRLAKRVVSEKSTGKKQDE